MARGPVRGRNLARSGRPTATAVSRHRTKSAYAEPGVVDFPPVRWKIHQSASGAALRAGYPRDTAARVRRLGAPHTKPRLCRECRVVDRMGSQLDTRGAKETAAPRPPRPPRPPTRSPRPRRARRARARPRRARRALAAPARARRRALAGALARPPALAAPAAPSSRPPRPRRARRARRALAAPAAARRALAAPAAPRRARRAPGSPRGRAHLAHPRASRPLRAARP